MTQILNVPMPADEAIKIIRAMLESNRMVRMSITGTFRSRYRAEEVTEEFKITSTNGLDKVGFRGDITINYISPIIPTYSVWDEVMILATGEIGEIIRQDRQYARDCYIAFPDEKIWHRWENYHRSEICKIA